MTSKFFGGLEDDDRSVTSVGQSLGNHAVYSTSHPAYVKIAALVSQEVGNLADRDAARKLKSNPVVMPVVLDSLQIEALQVAYPEMKLLNYGICRPGHAFFTASLVMANEYLLLQASHMATRVIHYGGSLMSAVLKDDMDVHVELNPMSASAVFAHHQDLQTMSRVVGDYAQLALDIGPNPARANYEKYLQRTDFVACVRSSTCGHKAEAYCADLASGMVSLPQFCAGMRQCQAAVGFGFFIYHPVMLLSHKGTIPGTGIDFCRTDDEMVFKYPEGVVGAESYPLDAWTSWITEHIVRVGSGKARKAYHMQLGKPRGCFMFFQVTEVDDSAEDIPMRHALDLPLADQHVVSAWSLKDLASDPTKLSSWEKHVAVVPSKVVNKLYEFGMQLSQENFSRYAIRKQISVMDRITVEGSAVTTGYRANSTDTDMLVNAVYAHVFVKRFESGMLSKEMMERLKRVAKFGSAGFASRVAAVASWAMMNAWDYTFGLLGDAVSSVCQWIERMFDSGADRAPVFELAPTYVSLSSVTYGWRRSRGLRFKNAVDSLTKFGSLFVDDTVRGGVLARVLSGVSQPRPAHAAAVVSDIPLRQGVLHTKHVEMQDGVMSQTQVRANLGASEIDELQDALVSELRVLNELDEPPADRHYMPTESVVRVESHMGPSDHQLDLDYVGTLNDVYEEFNPGVAQAPMAYDIASLSFDDQDRNLVADFLKLPRNIDTAPKDREYYVSKVLALGTPKRQETAPELLSSVSARNLAAPKVALPQDNSVIIPQIWEKFLDVACVPGARQLLESYSNDPVALEENSFRDWMSQAKPDALRAIRKQLEEDSQTLHEMDVGDYLMMLKADVKPTLSDKPLRVRTEPQVIVYHMKALSALYSSIFRVLVRRFLSLLKPEFHVNLLKDTKDIGKFIAANHPFGADLTYLENDFSKYDKSQDSFAFALEKYVFEALGMNLAMLEKWADGHVDCSIRSFTTGISLSVRYQRKSGDATTAMGNVILNVLSVVYAYSPSDVVWAVFMGDDSIVACRAVGTVDTAVQTLAEVFNLSAKMYITTSPYFASHFIVIDDDNHHVAMVPDPIKWIEKRSQPVSAVEPGWHEKYVSVLDSCQAYMHMQSVVTLGAMVANRYPVSQESADRLAPAIATAISTEARYRACYDEAPTKFLY